MVGREGAANLYGGASQPGYFQFFFPLDRRDSSAFDGNVLDQRRVIWMVPNAMVHMEARHPTRGSASP